MADIFGRQIGDRTIFSDEFVAGTPRQVMEQAIKAGGRDINWNCDRTPKLYTDAAESTSAAVGLITNNMQAVKAEADEILRLGYRMDKFIPVDTNVPEGATSNATTIINRTGTAGFIAKDGANVGASGASAGQVAYKIAYGGIVAEWSIQELRNALFAGIPINSEVLRAAMDACLYHIQSVGFSGNTEYGFDGLITNDKVGIDGGTAVDFNTATADEIVTYINGLITSIGKSSNEVLYQSFASSTLQMAVPTDAYDILTTRPYGDDRNKSIWDYLKMRNSWTNRTGKELVMESLPEANTAGATGDARMIIYPKDSRVLEMDMAISPRAMAPVVEPYKVITPLEYAISGTNWKRPELAVFADGILG